MVEPKEVQQSIKLFHVGKMESNQHQVQPHHVIHQDLVAGEVIFLLLCNYSQEKYTKCSFNYWF